MALALARGVRRTDFLVLCPSLTFNTGDLTLASRADLSWAQIQCASVPNEVI